MGILKKQAADALEKDGFISKEKARHAFKVGYAKGHEAFEEALEECAAVTLTVGIQSLMNNGIDFKSAYDYLTEGANTNLHSTIEKVLIKYGGVNQIGINLRALSQQPKGLLENAISALDNFYVNHIIPQAYHQDSIGYLFVRALTTTIGQGFVNGAHEEARRFYANEQNTNSEYYFQIQNILSHSNKNSISLEIALKTLNSDLSISLVRSEKNSILYRIGDYVGTQMQNIVNSVTKNRVLTQNSTDRIGMPLALAYPI